MNKDVCLKRGKDYYDYTTF